MMLVLAFVPPRPYPPPLHLKDWPKRKFMAISPEGVRSWTTELQQAMIYDTEAAVKAELDKYYEFAAGRLAEDAMVVVPHPGERGTVEPLEVIFQRRHLGYVATH